MSWDAYFCGGSVDLSKRVLSERHPPLYFKVARREPMLVKPLADDRVTWVSPRCDTYRLWQADERTRTAVYLFMPEMS